MAKSVKKNQENNVEFSYFIAGSTVGWAKNRSGKMEMETLALQHLFKLMVRATCMPAFSFFPAENYTLVPVLGTGTARCR